MRIRQHPGVIVGIKVAHYTGPEWDPVTRAVAAGRETNVPVMVDFGGHTPPLSLEDLLLKHLRPGDILTHTYAHVAGRIPIVDESGKVRPVCLGGAQARRHLRRRPRRRQLSLPAGGAGDEAGISARRDQHRPAHRQQNSGMKDILNTMSKFLNMGMPLQDVIKANTATAAEVIKRPDLGHLSVGAEADIAVLNLRRGTFGFIDTAGGKLVGDQKLECELTVKGGQVVWDLNGISRPMWTEVPAPGAKR